MPCGFIRAHPHYCVPLPPTPLVFSAFSFKLHSTSGICFCSSLFLNDGEGNGNPLQYSCLERPKDRGAWWAAVYGIAQSRTQLKRLRSSSSFLKDALQCFIPASTKFCWYFSFHLQGPLEAFPDLKIKVLLSLYPSRVVACCTATAC